MLFLTGATGRLGHHVLELVLAQVPANKVRVMARTPAKLAAYARLGVEVVQADYNDAGSLRAALKGIHTALLISSSEIGKRAAQHEAFLQAACKNAVARLVYTSLLRADVSTLRIAEEHWATEEAIRHAGIPATILRNGWYLENFTDRLAQMRADGGLMGSAKEGKVCAASRRDYAEAAAHVLLGKSGVGGTHELAGDAGFTLAELVAEVAKQTGEAASYTDVAPERLRAIYLKAGVDESWADFLVDVDVAIAQGELADDTGDLHKLLGRPPTTLQQAVASSLASPFSPAPSLPAPLAAP